METQLVKNHASFASQAEREGESGGECFLFLPATHRASLGSWGLPLSFTKTNVTMEMVLLTPRGQQGGQKVLVQLLLPCTGVKRTALLVREQASLPWLRLTHRSPPSLGIQSYGKASQRQWADMCEIQSPTPVMPQYDPLKGAQSR